jgi:hypothetical protein
VPDLDVGRNDQVEPTELSQAVKLKPDSEGAHTGLYHAAARPIVSQPERCFPLPTGGAGRDEDLDGVEQLRQLERKVIAFMSQNHIDPDLAIEVFVLDPASQPYGD